MDIQKGRVVGMHYTLRNDEGEIIDTSEGREPLVFLQGFGNIINGLESELEGKNLGDKLDVVVEPEQGYGVRHEQLIQRVPSSAFEGVDELQVGMQFQAQTEQGPVPIRVVEINGEEVTIDGNHELAGVRLHFAVSIETIREASKEELEHGHVH
ncbi:peptidylprolyl isomerase [Ketobacter sp. MCCC 1A13808]|uniref:FKBP-type peptidyl-prolyl cis-trans isomerase n=1 Tax=Ketobacter sp. MCCC 1A13808 TaxID=2602738 RepID=UPI000F21BF68|nr:peptidylprolyl isomerase [Ketobacter sp. MCCC 1A13808]MVF14143.1 peptidylprolyl isomerase [Ketobacter sp. MCCC 1A13808]RLP54055.1 MAG: peptidylprolyl isomerase [Ketobacter sp.]